MIYLLARTGFKAIYSWILDFKFNNFLINLEKVIITNSEICVISSPISKDVARNNGIYHLDDSKV